MGKEKRKVRLDKASGTAHAEFIGFSSFASSVSASEASSTTSPTASSSWSPIYTGSDENLQTLFPRISQKRDATTKVKALQQLQSFLSSRDSSATDSSDDRFLRRQQVEAIQHFAWLYYNKLHFDASPVVRAASLEVWLRASDRIPKAVSQLVTAVQPELLGMIYTASQADRGLQSNIAARAQELIINQSDWPWERGLVELYAVRMLSFGRSSTMYEALFAKKNSKTDAQSPSKEKIEMSESHKGAAEEQFERIVGACIDALRVWVSSSRTERNSDLDTSLWWKTFASALPALRLKTLHLLMACCQNKVSVPSQAASMLTQELSSERHVTNVPAVMNALVAYLSFIRQSACEGVDVSLFVKPVTKVLKKACYGAPANDWAPTLLPLSALLAKVKAEYASTVLAGAWDGRSLVLGGDRDRFTLAKAVAESASHWLLLARPTLAESDEEKSILAILARDLVGLWVEAFQYSLSIRLDPSNTSSPLADAHSALLDQLCSDLARFYQAGDGNDNAFKILIDQEVFWKESFYLKDCDLETTSVFLGRLRKLKGKEKMLPQVRKLFHSTLIPYQQSSGASPSQQAYLFLTSAINCFESRSLFCEEDERMKKFIMNDLLRWLILHTSRVSQKDKSSWIVKCDFEILYHTLRGLPDRNKLWDAIVRELCSAQCDLKYLTCGLDFLVTAFDTDSTWIACPCLSQFAISQGKVAGEFDWSTKNADIGDTSLDVPTIDDFHSYRNFLSVCVGILCDSPGEEKALYDYSEGAIMCKTPLVGQDVITEWIDSATSQTKSRISPLLQLLMQLSRQTIKDLDAPFALSEDDRIRIFLHVWKIGGRDCDAFLEDQLQRDISLQSRFLTSASTHLSKELSNLLENNRESGNLVNSWVSHACRLFGLTETVETFDASLTAHVRRSILLCCDQEGDPWLHWKSKKSLMCTYALALFNELQWASQRVSVLLGDERNLCDDSKMETILRLLILTSEAPQLPGLSTTMKRDGNSNHLFTLLVGDGGLDREFLNMAVDRLLLNLNTYISEDGQENTEETLKIFSLLSMFVMCLFGSLFDPSNLAPEDIVEGQMILYIANPEEPERRLLATVKKVHFDSQSGHYFTIIMGEQSENTERQTVIERLRKVNIPLTEGRKVPTLAKLGSQAERRHARDLILSKVVKPFLIPLVNATSLISLLAESLALLGGYIGLGEEKGIGSPTYSIHQILTLCDANLRGALDCDDYDSAIRLLWFSSLGLGYGLYCDPVRWSHQSLQLSFLDSLNVIDTKYTTKWPLGNLELDCAVVGWLTITMGHIIRESTASGGKSEYIKTAATLLFRLANSVLAVAINENLTSAISIGSLAIEEGVRSMSRYEAALDISPIAIDSFNLLIRCFCCEVKGLLYWNKAPSSVLKEVMNACKGRGAILGSLAAACNSNYAKLLAVLFDQERCHLAFRLLKIAVDSKYQSGPSKHLSQSELTSSRLAKWSIELSQDEIEELEEDLLIVSEWIPEEMLKNMEDWAIEDLDSFSGDQATGQLLSWLIFLATLEQAAASNFRNRPAFVSYLSKCGVFNHILNLALLNEETINSGKRNCPPPILLFEDLSFNEGRVPLSGVASVVLFRSIEVLPALAKRWWEEDCPKVYLPLVQSFVEKYVGPRILERELERIRNTPGVFGNMNVSASSVSREIRAEYVQDDFTLKVLISLPPAFPFRSAEVDCSKTLGVPQNRWKRWSLQIMMMLNSQGGTLIDALILWKDNVDKEFEGIEACPVCYSVLHVKTHKLPGLQCKTCTNRFHSDCLMEWFRSSGKSQCVLCQQPWEGTRVV